MTGFLREFVTMPASTLTKRCHNFSAGPATLPLPILEEIQSELLDYQDSGMSLIEMSHRGAIFESLLEESFSLLRKLAAIPDNFDILYMSGGASSQFALVPLNLSEKGRSVAYVNTGIWSQKAIKEAKIQQLDVQIAGSSEDQNFTYIPTQLQFNTNLDYVHLTSNNTIFGTQYNTLPQPPQGSKLVIDMSSDFLSKPIDWQNIGLAYAGAQKNVGPSGLTIVVIDKAYYEREKDTTPSIWRYSTFGKNQSMYNTPPTFQIYAFTLVLRWLQSMGGLNAVLEHNQKKAQLLYGIIDAYPDFFQGHAQTRDRSLMNVTWRFHDNSLDKLFLEGSQKLRMNGLKGHRSVGGLRASIYNGMTQEGCSALATYMKQFWEEHG